MEPVSLAVGILPLLSLCFEVLEKVTTFREYGSHSRRLSARFASAKLKFQDWTIGAGFINGLLVDPHNPQLDRPEVVAVVKTILSCLRETFQKAESTNDKLSLLQDRATGLKRITASAMSTKDAMSWAVRGKAAFTEDVDSFEILVDRLYELVPLQDPQTVVVNNVKIETTASATPDIPSLKSIEILQQEILLAVQAIRQNAKFEALRTIDDWLDTPTIDQEFEKHLEARLEGTCDWLFKTQVYLEWESAHFSDNRAKMLWVHGPAGHGKTVLCTAVIHRLRQQPDQSLAFFLSTPHVQGGHVPVSMLRSWIAQICRVNDDALDLTRECTTSEKSGRKATQAELWSLFTAIVTNVNHCVLILDGFDEFERLDESRSDFLHRLKRAVKNTQTRLMISSRPETDIESELLGPKYRDPSISVFECKVSADVLSEDISRFSKKTVADQLPTQSSEQQSEIAEHIAEKCQGMFLWIKMQKPHLRAGKSRKQLLKVIESMPTGLPQAYNRDWSQIQALEEEDQRRAIDILRWTCFAMSPLTVGELTEALVHGYDMSDPCEDDLPDQIDVHYINGEIKALCGSLVEVRAGDGTTKPSSWTTHLIHFSAKEFLITVLPLPSPACTTPSRISVIAQHQMHLAEVCMRYLICEQSWGEKNWDDQVLSQGFFQSYASYYWYFHRKEASSISDELQDLTLRAFDVDNSHFAEWTKDDRFHRSTWTKREVENGLNSRLYLAVMFELPHILQHLHDSNMLDFTPTSFTWGTALQAAAWMEDSIFDRLISWGADVNAKGGHHGNALFAAIIAGSVHKVKMLLKNGAKTDTFDRAGRSSLTFACRNDNTEILRILLEHDASLVKQADFVIDPFFQAVKEDKAMVVKLLLEHGVDVDIVDRLGWTALQLACLQSKLETVNLLIDYGANLSQRSPAGETPLSLAVRSKRYKCIKTLLSHGAGSSQPVHLDGDFGGSVQIAIRSGDAEALQLLLEAGASLDTASDRVSQPLGIAIDLSRPDLVELLVEAGASLTLPVHLGRTPFEWIEHVWPENPHLAAWRSQVNLRVSEQDRPYWLKRTIYDIATRLEDEFDPVFDVAQLTRCFAMLDAAPEAVFISHQGTTSSGADNECLHNMVCDGCQAYPIVATRYICQECPNVDVCPACFSELDSILPLRRCQDHKFLRVEGTPNPPSTDFVDRLDDPDIKQWLRDIRERFLIDGPEPPLVPIESKAQVSVTTEEQASRKVE